MSDSRNAIFSAMRRSLKRGPLPDAQAAALQDRLQAPKPILVPERAQVSGEDAITAFTVMAERASATVVRIASRDQLGQTVANYLKEHNQPTDILLSGDDLVSSVADHPMVTARTGLPTPTDRVSVVAGLCGVAETGTVLLTSGDSRATTLNFLPDTHIVVVRSGDIVGGMEEAWGRLRQSAASTGMPRTVNMVTGPSRTGDIEQTLQMGAHGPLRVHIVLIDEAQA